MEPLPEEAGELDWAHLGSALRLARNLTRLTQQQLADAIGMDRKTIGNYETGRIPIGSRGPVVPEGYFQVASALGLERVDVEAFLAGPRLPYQEFLELLSRVPLEYGQVSDGNSELPDKIRVRGKVLEWGLNEARSAQANWPLNKVIDPQAVLGYRHVPPPAALSDARLSLDDAIRLFPTIVQFGRICVDLGADARVRNILEDAAQRMLDQAAERTETLESRTSRKLYMRRRGDANPDTESS
jgi:transcriptional regulator with XRE-family HTH domain